MRGEFPTSRKAWHLEEPKNQKRQIFYTKKKHELVSSFSRMKKNEKSKLGLEKI